jgi:3-hydroxybutyryl-CoA dehydratase
MSAAHTPFDSIKIGLAAEIRWSVSAKEIDDFAALSGDYNPLHIDEVYARNCGFPDRVAHGFLLGSKVSAFVGMTIPGRDCFLLEAQLAWPRPIYSGDEIVIRGEVVELSTEQRIVKIKIRATRKKEDNVTVVGRGWALCQSRS